ncbi:MAG: NAD(P)/FAD-dependent oxidoreductase [Polyangiaceae bacterium]
MAGGGRAADTAGDARPHVVIVGGGFGGLNAAKALRRLPVRVTLLDRKNHHTFQPLLYQVATCALNPSEIAVPIRRVLRRQKNVRVLLADVSRIDLQARTVFFDGGELDYDFLIAATGATHSYFGRDDWAAFAPGLKTIEDALEIRRRVLFAYEAAEREDNRDRRRAWMTFVVVGAGPTGVELAGALSEIARHTLARDFRNIDPTEARVILVEGNDRVLPTYVGELSRKARRSLVALEVDVMTGARVTAIDADGVNIGSERIEARTTLWAAGVAASPLAKSLGVPLDKAGRVKVEPDLSLPDHPEVFVIGDLALVEHDGEVVPGVAQGAIQGASHAADGIRDLGSLATIGRAAAVAQFGKLHLSGFIAWAAWLLVHILVLIGFKNRYTVLLQWAYSYLSYDRGARLITGEPLGHFGHQADTAAAKGAPVSVAPPRVVAGPPP